MIIFTVIFAELFCLF